MRFHALVQALVCSLCSFVLPTAVAAAGWTHIGPFDMGARVISIAVDPEKPDRAFAGSASGGLWLTDHPETEGWCRVNTGHPVIGVGAVAIHPKDPSIVYVGTGEAYGYRQDGRGLDTQTSRGIAGIGILKTTEGRREPCVDGGEMAFDSSLPFEQSELTGVQHLEIVPHPTDDERYTVWAATTEGVYRLDTTRGATGEEPWELSLPVVMATSLTVHPRRPDEVVASFGAFGSEGNGLYKTVDGGETWQRLIRGLPISYRGKAIVARSPSHPEVLYAAIGNRTFFAYANDGTGSKPGNTYRCVYGFSDPALPPDWLLRSDDGGDSWRTQTNADFAESQGWYSIGLAVAPHDPDAIYLGGESFFRSFDGGETLVSEYTSPSGSTPLFYQVPYDQTNPSLTFVDFHEIVIPRGSPQTVWAVADQGVFRSTDQGRTFRRSNKGLDVMQFYRGASISQEDRDFIAVNAQDYGPGFLLYTGANESRCGKTDAAEKNGPWSLHVGYGYEGGYTAFDPKDRILYVGQHFQSRVARVRLTEEGCIAKIDEPDTGEGGPCFIPDVDPFRRSNSCLDNAAWNAPLVVAPSNPKVLYAARDVVYASDRVPEYPLPEGSDACSNQASGATWAPTSLGDDLDGDPILAMAVSPIDERRLVIATSPRYTRRMNVYDSRDGGATWRRITGELSGEAAESFPMSIVFDRHDEDASTVYLVLGGYGFPHLWRTDLAAETPSWEALGEDLPDVWHADLVVDPADARRLYAANDRGVFTSGDGGASWSPMNEGLYAGIESSQLLLFERDRLLRLVTHGNGVWEYQLP